MIVKKSSKFTTPEVGCGNISLFELD